MSFICVVADLLLKFSQQLSMKGCSFVWLFPVEV